jgi:hypothetical protein
MSSTANGHEPSAAEEDELKLPTSHLTRPSPDAIIADEADENALLGNESDSEPSTSRRNSTIQPADRRSSRRKSQMLVAPSEPATERTPTQTTFSPKRSSLRAPLAYKTGPNEADLQAQVADLTNQVTGLNTKLVGSFMRISDLEDDLSDKQEQLTWHQTKVTSLEKEREQHLAALNTGLLVEKAHVTSEMQKMMERVMEETAERGKAISDKEKIEAELDDLSSNLFSEANKMVAVERLARAIAEEKSQSMEERLKDTEEIMEQQQKRLAELQSVVEKGDKARSAAEVDGKGVADTQNGESKPASSTSILPSPDLEQLRLDIIPYTELRSFLNHLRKLRLQLAPFYNYPLQGLAPSNLPSPLASRSNSPAPQQARVVSSPSAHSSTMLSPFSVAGVSRHKDFPSLPSNVEQLINLPSQVSSIHLLKRINEEDCEPCLRLDVAPGLNWLTRRQLQTSILEGNLLIEPVFGGGLYDEAEVRNRAMGSPPAACAMCGKSLVNVPLPGGGANGEGGSWMSAAGNAANSLQASVGNSFPSREQTSSPPLPSTSFFNTSTSPNQTSSNLQKKSSTLFSTLRNIGSGSPRPSLSTNLSSSNLTIPNQPDASHSAVEEDQFANRLAPIPTHIFRIGETSSSRYLLCPDYCLQRLRVTCEFWSYIRHLERAVVLEGKLAWDEEQSPDLPEKEGGSIKEITAEADGKTDESHTSAATVSDKGDEEKNNDVDEVKDEAKGEDDNDDKEEEGDKEGDFKATRPISTHGSNTDDEDGFADAQSIASDLEDDAEEVGTPKIVKEALEVKDDSLAATTTTTLPPLPPRGKPRRPVPAPPPALPPRRSFTNSSAVETGPEPKRLLSAKIDSHLTWEEKVWLEITRHRADMWSARIGIQKEGL